MMNLDLERQHAVLRLILRHRIPVSRPRERVWVIKLMLITLAWHSDGETFAGTASINEVLHEMGMGESRRSQRSALAMCEALKARGLLDGYALADGILTWRINLTALRPDTKVGRACE